MYAKIKLTRQVFKLWKWKMFVTDELFIGPFATKSHREVIMRLIAALTARLLTDQLYVLVRWEELTVLPSGVTAIGPEDSLDVVASFVMDV